MSDKRKPTPSAERERGETNSAWERGEAAKSRDDKKHALQSSLDADQITLAGMMSRWRDAGVTSTGAAELISEVTVFVYGSSGSYTIAPLVPIDPATLVAIRSEIQGD